MHIHTKSHQNEEVRRGGKEEDEEEDAENTHTHLERAPFSMEQHERDKNQRQIETSHFEIWSDNTFIPKHASPSVVQVEKSSTSSQSHLSKYLEWKKRRLNRPPFAHFLASLKKLPLFKPPPQIYPVSQTTKGKSEHGSRTLHTCHSNRRGSLSNQPSVPTSILGLTLGPMQTLPCEQVDLGKNVRFSHHGEGILDLGKKENGLLKESWKWAVTSWFQKRIYFTWLCCRSSIWRIQFNFIWLIKTTAKNATYRNLL